jgi:sulfatase modifying factor 1
MRKIMSGCGFLTLVFLIYGYGESRVALYLAAVVPIKAGWFTMGSDEREQVAAARICSRAKRTRDGCSHKLFQNEGPAHKVYVSAFRIDRTEVSNQAYQRCVVANACTPSHLPVGEQVLGAPNLPAVYLTWYQAQHYCRWVGGGLPTEAQWERAASGLNHRRFPWGFYYNSRLANHGSFEMTPDTKDGYEFAAPVDAFADGKSPFGLLNMAGNVWEFTADYYASDYQKVENRVDPTGPKTGDARVIRGGSWRSPVYTLRTTHRAKIEQSESRPDVGFRCAYQK